MSDQPLVTAITVLIQRFFGYNGTQVAYEVVSIVIILEYGMALNAPANDMVQRAGRVNS
jgi:hypothetical protein